MPVISILISHRYHFKVNTTPKDRRTELRRSKLLSERRTSKLRPSGDLASHI